MNSLQKLYQSFSIKLNQLLTTKNNFKNLTTNEKEETIEQFHELFEEYHSLWEYMYLNPYQNQRLTKHLESIDELNDSLINLTIIEKMKNVINEFYFGNKSEWIEKYQNILLFEQTIDDFFSSISLDDVMNKILNENNLFFVIETTDNHFISILLRSRVFSSDKWIKDHDCIYFHTYKKEDKMKYFYDSKYPLYTFQITELYNCTNIKCFNGNIDIYFTTHFASDCYGHKFKPKRLLIYSLNKHVLEIEQMRHSNMWNVLFRRYQSQGMISNKILFNELQFDKILFDSKMDIGTPNGNILFKKLRGKSDVLILVEVESFFIGCFIREMINETNDFIEDEDMFVFTTKNGELMQYFGDYSLDSPPSICFKNAGDTLVVVGDNDIVIHKEIENDEPTQNYWIECRQNEFFYRNNRNAMLGKVTSNNVHRILAYQMKETNFYRYHSSDYESIVSSMITDFQLNDLCKSINSKFPKIIFDSNETSISQEDYIYNDNQRQRRRSYDTFNTFGDIIYGRSKLCFLIQTNDNYVFGGYINEEIDKVAYWKYGSDPEGYIFDRNAFLFNCDNDGINICRIKRNYPKAFLLYSDTSDYLFAFGNKDVLIRKSEYNSDCYQQSKSSFVYDWYDFLIGRTGSYCFYAKRIVVLQF